MTPVAALTLADTDVSALCAQVDPDLWHPGKGETNTTAKAICHRCDIEAACLTTALADPELEGIWGGTSQRERQALRGSDLPKVRAPINHGTTGGYRTHQRRGETVCPECKAARAAAYQKRKAAAA